jgi:hypothetical protein
VGDGDDDQGDAELGAVAGSASDTASGTWVEQLARVPLRRVHAARVRQDVGIDQSPDAKLEETVR